MTASRIEGYRFRRTSRAANVFRRNVHRGERDGFSGRGDGATTRKPGKGNPGGGNPGGEFHVCGAGTRATLLRATTPDPVENCGVLFEGLPTAPARKDDPSGRLLRREGLSAGEDVPKGGVPKGGVPVACLYVGGSGNASLFVRTSSCGPVMGRIPRSRGQKEARNGRPDPA